MTNLTAPQNDSREAVPTKSRPSKPYLSKETLEQFADGRIQCKHFLGAQRTMELSDKGVTWTPHGHFPRME